MTRKTEARVLRIQPVTLAVWAALGMAPLSAAAVPVSWVPDADGFWGVAANWSSNPVLPGAADDVTIDVGGATVRTITHDTGSHTIRTLNNAETVAVTDGSTLTLSSGGLSSTNTGTLRADGGGSTLNFINSVLNNNGGTVSAINSGKVNLSNTTVNGGTLQTANGGVVGVNGSTATLNGVTNQGLYDAGGTLNTTTHLAGTLTNNGTFAMNSDGHVAAVRLLGDVTLAGNGTVSLSNNLNNVISGNTGAERLTHTAGQTIQGAGQIGTNAMALTNQGLIVANQGNALVIDPTDGANGVINTGTLRADAGGTLRLLNGSFNNTGGVIEAVNGSAVQLAGATVTGGTLQTAGGGTVGTLEGSAATLDGVTNQGLYDAGGTLNTTTHLSGTLTNNGTFAMNSDGHTSAVRLLGDVTLAGNGTVSLSNNANNVISGNTGAERLTHTAGQTLQGAGQIGQNAMTLTNQGLIVANQGTPLVIDPTDGANGVINTGTLRADAGGTLRLLNGSFNNTGGVIEAVNGSAVQLAGATVTGGTLQTAGGGTVGTLEGSAATLDGVTNQGLYDAGGTLNTTTNLSGTLTNNGTFAMNSDGHASAVRLLGDVTLAGNGTVSLSNNLNNVISGNTGAERLTHTAGQTIQGAGQIGANAMSFTNRGLVDANVGGPGAQLLIIDPTDSSVACPTCGVTNGSILQASNGGTLRLQGGTFTNFEGTANGTIQALNGSTVQIAGATVTGGIVTTYGTGVVGTLNGSAATLDGVTNQGLYDAGGTLNTTTNLAGTLTNNGTFAMNSDGHVSAVRLLGDVTLAGTGTVSLSNNLNNVISGSTGAERLTHTAGQTIQGAGQIGTNAMTLTNQGLIVANQGTPLIIDPTDGANGVINTGTLRADAGGTLRLLNGSFNNTGGVIEAVNGSAVQLAGATVTGGTLQTSNGGTVGTLEGSAATLDGVTNQGLYDAGGTLNTTTHLSGTLTNNGTFAMNSDGHASAVRLLGDVTLAGTGTVSLSNNLNNVISGSTGAERLTHTAGQTIQGAGQIGANAMALTNQGLIVANQGTPLTIDTANVAGSLANSGTLRAVGGSTLTIVDGFGNSGTVHAAGGTINAQAGFTGATGMARIDAGGVLNLGADTAVGTLAHDGSSGGSLNLGSHNLTVNVDYDNANFGTGNAFDAHANVAGTGQILAAGDVAQAITGTGVTNGETANATLTMGNVHVGANTFNYQIANTGSTGPDLRGALQTSVNGGNITDARLSGSGVTASNFGPVAAGTHSGNLEVVFTADTAGALAPLTGQVVHIVNNFDNVAEQNLNLVLGSGAAAYHLAAGSASPSPVILGNQRVGGSLSQSLTVTNTAPAGGFTEGLNASFGANTGNATNNGGNLGLLAGGASNGTSLAVGVDTATAGAKSGTVTLNYVSDGSGTSGLGTTHVGSQTLDVSGDVYRLAQGDTTPLTVDFGNRHVGDTVSQALSVSNTAAADGYSERLNAGFGATTGAATHNGGAVGLLAAGGTDNGSLAVGIDTGSAGAKSGTVAVNYVSDGTGTSGLAAIGAGGQNVAVSGTVWRLAEANTLGTVGFGNVHVGDTVSQALSISNLAANDGFSERLNAGFGGTSDARITTNGGTINLLGAGATDNTSLRVGLDTSAAGAVNGTATVNFQSDGQGTSGLGITPLPSQNVPVTGTIATNGNVFRLAEPSQHTPEPVNFGNVRIGTAADQALTLSNLAPDDGFSEKLNASIASNGSPVTASGSFNLLGPQQTDSTSLHVGIDTGSAGVKTGSATIALVSDGTGTSGLGQTALPSQTVNVSGTVYRLADPTLNTGSVVLAARVGDAGPSAGVSLTNSSPDGFTEGLKASFGTVAAGFTGAGAIANLAAGQTDGSSLQVSLNTNTAGTFGGTAQIGFESTGAGTTGAADLAIGSGAVDLTGRVYTPAVAQVNTPQVDFGIVHVGDSVGTRDIGVTNAAPATALNDVLQGSINGVTGSFTGLGSGLGAGLGAGESGVLQVGLDTSTAGVFTGSADAAFISHNPDLADLSLGGVSIGLTAQVNNFADVALIQTGGNGSLTETGNLYTLDFGDFLLGSTGLAEAFLAVGNAALGPADFVGDGSFNLAALGPFFQAGGFIPLPDLDAGDFVGGMSLLFDPTGLGIGSYDGLIRFTGFGRNGSGYQDQQDFTLRFTAEIIQAQPAPEPASWLLMLAGLPLLRRRPGGR